MQEVSFIKKYFWDTDFKNIDIKKHSKYILQRILENGDEKAVRWMFRNFLRKEILSALKNSRNISRRSFVFWNLILNK